MIFSILFSYMNLNNVVNSIFCLKIIFNNYTIIKKLSMKKKDKK